MACVNKNSPEFQKLATLTKLDHSDISMAIDLWQEHNQTDMWPSSAQIISMVRNRQSYGGMDLYLKAISKPVDKADIEAAMKNLPARVKTITDALQSLIPGIKITLHDTQTSYEEAIKKAQEGKLTNQTSNAFYNPKPGSNEIHMNVWRAVQTMSPERKRNLNTVEHEATHPLLDIIETINPGTISTMFKDLVALEKEFGLDGKYTRKFASFYGNSERAEEAVVEFIADIASGNIDLSKAPESLKEKVSKFISNIFKRLGINIKPYLRTDKEIVKFANEIKDLFSGKKTNLDRTKIKQQKTAMPQTAISRGGKPIIVYRSQKDSRKQGVERQSGHAGIYFSENKESTKIYGDKTNSYYLDIKNPIVLKDKEWNLSVMTKSLMDKLIKDGYDGAVWERNGEMYEIIAFNENQVIPTNDLKFQIIGEQGARNLDNAEERYFRINNLGVARKMEKAGNTVAEIKYATGWERGANNGKWRYEILDIRARKAVGVATFSNAVLAQSMLDDLNKTGDFDTDRKLYISYLDKLYEELGANKYNREHSVAIGKALREKNKEYLPPNTIKGNIQFFTNVRNGYAILQDVIEHEDLFKAYPDFKYIKVKTQDFWDDKGETTYATWDPSRREITISNNLFEDDAVASLIHEIQHAIQYEEGFESGGNVKMFTKARNNIQALFKDIGEVFDKLGYEKWLVAGGEVDNTLNRNFNGMYSFAETQPKNTRDKMVSKLDEANKVISENKQIFGRTNIYTNIKDEELYRRLAGEVEARNAEERRKLSHEQRIKTPFALTEDVTRDNQIFLGVEAPYNPKDLLVGTDKAKAMTAYGDKYAFFSYTEGIQDRLHTAPLKYMVNSGNKQYSASVKKEEVYPFEEDPNGYLGPGPIGDQIESVKEKAKKDGYKVILINSPSGRVVAHPISKLEMDEDSFNPEPFNNISLASLIQAGEQITTMDTLDELSNNKYILKDGVIRKILSVKKINTIFHKYFWHNVNYPGVIYETDVTKNDDEVTRVVTNKIKWSLSETDNSDNTKSPYEESVAFGRLVTDIAIRLKEGFLDVNQARNIAAVDADSYEIFNDAYDIAVIRSGFPPSSSRQFAIYDLIKQLPKGPDRPTAQELYRNRHEMLDSLRITPVMLKQILPDAHLYKDKRLNQTWKRILFIIEDVGDYVSKTLDKGRKFQITDTEGNESGYWDQTALGFADMIAYVNAAVEADPENKEKLLNNVRAALKKSGDDEMLQLLEVAIAAAGQTNITDLSKVVRAGSLAGRVLNVIKRYIGSAKFGDVRTDLAAATIIAENDEILSTVQVGDDDDSPTALDLIDEINTILRLSQMSDDERQEFIEENSNLIDNVGKFLGTLGLGRGTGSAAKDKKKIQRGNTKIAKGLVSLTDVLANKYPDLIKLSKSELDPDVLKSIRQIIRGLIDIHGTDTNTLKTELQILFNDENILLDVDVILSDQGIIDYINNVDRHNIRNGAIEALGASEDTYTKMVLDQVLRAINAPPSKANRTDQLITALDRGELTKKALNAVRDQIDLIDDEEKRNKLLDRLNEKFVTIFDSAIPNKILSDAVAQSMGKTTRAMVDAYLVDPDRSKEVLAAQAMINLGMTPEQAAEWSNQIADKVQARLEKAKKRKIKSILSTKISNPKKAEQIEEKVFKIISDTANKDGSIPSETDIDGQLIDIKQVFADKYNVRLNDPRAIAKIIKLTNLMKLARTQARKEQLYAQIMLQIKNMKLSPNKYVRGIKAGIMELPTFVMANILSGVNTAYKATIAGFYNSLRAYLEGAIIGRGIDFVYKGEADTSEVFDKLKKSNSKSPTNHLMLTYRLFWDVMRNGSASISQTNIPEHGLSNFDMHLNNSLALRTLYFPFRWLSAIDRATMNFNHNRLARRRAVNSLLEFGKNNVNLDGQAYSRTAGGAGWYKIDGNNKPEIDPLTGNIKTIRDPRTIELLNAEAKKNFTTTEFLLEAERLLGLNNIEEIYQGVIEEWNALVELSESTKSSPEEKEELKKLGINTKNLKKVNKIEDFAAMDGKTRRFVAQEIYKKVHDSQNEAIDRAVGIESGMYSAQGTVIPGWPAGILYQTATMIDNAIVGGINSKNVITRTLTYTLAVPAKLYSFLITKAPSIGYGAALLYSPISFLTNLGNLMAYVSGRPWMRIAYDAKDKAWRFNGLTTKDIQRATGVTNLRPEDLVWSRNEKVLKVLKEGYTVVSESTNTFSLKPERITTIGGQGGNAEIATILLRQAMSTASFAALVALMYDCPEGDCELSDFGKKAIEIFKLNGYGAMKDWLYKAENVVEKMTGYKPVVDKFGNPTHNTIRVSPEMGPLEFRIPINEINNAIAITTFTRINDELEAGVKITPEDMLLRYMIYSHFDLIQDNLDISVGGLSEYLATMFSFFNQDPRTMARERQKASSSVARRLMSALTPKMINEADKFILDMQNKNMWSVKKEGFREQLVRKIPLNIPFVRRYVAELDSAYQALPYTYEYTDWQMYLAKQKETGPGESDVTPVTRDDNFGVQTENFNINTAGRRTVKAPNGEVAKTKAEAINAGKAKYKENGYFAVAKEFDRMLELAIKESDINDLLRDHKTEEAMDRLAELAKEIKQDPEFKIFKKEQMEPKGE